MKVTLEFWLLGKMGRENSAHSLLTEERNTIEIVLRDTNSVEFNIYSFEHRTCQDLLDPADSELLQMLHDILQHLENYCFEI